MSEALIIDCFAGGGGASTGIEMALGRSPDYAINHDPVAVAMHAVNHPESVHLCQNVYKVDPLDHFAGKHIGFAWFSPDCKDFSKAKGGTPVRKNIRDLAWIIPGWIERIQKSGGRVYVVAIENVEEFQQWGPLILTPKGLSPDPERRGETFKKWCAKLRRLGGKIDIRELRASDYGAPTIRKRVFILIRFDGQPIVWPEPTHGDPKSDDVKSGKLKPWRSAAEIIDWSIPCPSIFDTKAEIKQKYGLQAQRPLADASQARIARGVRRYYLDSDRPFLISVAHGDSGGRREYPLDEPLHTVTGSGVQHAVVTPSITRFNTGATGSNISDPLPTITANSFQKRPGGAAPVGVIAPVVTRAQQGGGNRDATDPLHTVCASPKDQNAVITPVLTAYYGKGKGSPDRSSSLQSPLQTVVTENRHSVAAIHLAQHNGNGVFGRAATAPLSTATHAGSQQQVVATHMMSLKGSDRRDSGMDDPARTVCAGGGHASIVAAGLFKYYGTDQAPHLDEPLHTVTTKDRFGLFELAMSAPPFTPEHEARAREVAEFMRAHGEWDGGEFVTKEIAGITMVIVDIGLRMLTPRELFNAQGFPADYEIDRDADGNVFTKSNQVGRAGNSVCPPVAAAITAANVPHLAQAREAAE